MRVLLLFRGCPASGKSTYIKEHGLEKYTLSPDDLRLKIQSPVLGADGKETISQKNDKEVWKILFNLHITFSPAKIYVFVSSNLHIQLTFLHDVYINVFY